ncbi:MAG: hypothetical protein K8H88_00070 [Sandaracinaceae bacterium]|nr:hypothetical protein [Sandaracinaceae bacterium]
MNLGQQFVMAISLAACSSITPPLDAGADSSQLPADAGAAVLDAGVDSGTLDAGPASARARWATAYPAAGTAAIATGPSDRVYVVGYVFGASTFGSTTLSPDSLGDFLLLALDTEGDVLWATSFGDPVVAREIQSPRITVDDDGDIITATTDRRFDNRQVANAVWIRKHSALDGSVLWERRLDPHWNPGSLDCQPDGDVVVGGHSYGSADLGQGAVPDGAISVLELDGATGSTQWLTTFGAGLLSGFAHDRVLVGARASDGHVIVFSHYRGAFDFGSDRMPVPPPGTEQLDASGLFLGELDGLGAPVIGRAVLPVAGPINDLLATDLAVRSDGFTILGHFRGTLDLGLGVRTTTNITGTLDGFVASYTAVDAPVWARATQSGWTYVAMAVGPSGESVSIGHSDEPDLARFGPGWSPPPAGSMTSLLMARLDGAGAPELRALFGTLAFAGDVAVDSLGNAYVAGAFCAQLDFGGPRLSCTEAGSTLHGFIASLPPGYLH